MKGKVAGYWNKILMEILGLLFRVNVTCFFAFLSGLLDWIVLITFLYGLKDLLS